jgi:hypothetical protein
MPYGADSADLYRRAAPYVDKILDAGKDSGQKLTDMPRDSIAKPCHRVSH